MKFTAALFALASASFAAAQDLGNLPPCATECAGGYLINGIGDCGRDPKCICTNETFIKDIQCCLLEKCPTSDIEAAAGFAITFCKNNGATDFPTKATCATAAATQTTQTTAVVTTGTASSAAITVSASNSSALSSAVSSITSAASSAASSAPTSNPGPRQTAAAGLGAIGGLMAAVAML